MSLVREEAPLDDCRASFHRCPVFTVTLVTERAAAAAAEGVFGTGLVEGLYYNILPYLLSLKVLLTLLVAYVDTVSSPYK